MSRITTTIYICDGCGKQGEDVVLKHYFSIDESKQQHLFDFCSDCTESRRKSIERWEKNLPRNPFGWDEE